MPLFSFNPDDPEQRPKGHGTAFRVDPWSCCATAFHVLEDILQVNRSDSAISLRQDINLAALAVSGTGYGVIPVSEDSWRPFAGTFGFARIRQPLVGEARIRNLTELMALRRVHRQRVIARTFLTFLSTFLSGTQVSASPFWRWVTQDLDDDDDDKRRFGGARPISKYLYGSVGVITDVESADATRSSPWPIIRIDANWPGGMSGGPVFNEAGNVVGVVSTGFQRVRGAAATFFSGWDMPTRVFTSKIDPSNPGAFLCWGGFDAAGELVRAGQNRASVEKFCLEHGHPEIGFSFNPATGDVVKLDPCESPYA